MQQEDKVKKPQDWLVGLAILAFQARGKISEMCAASMSADVLQDDSRRALRPVVLVLLALAHFGRMVSIVAGAGIFDHIVFIVTSALLAAVGMASRGRRCSLKVDAAGAVALLLMFTHGARCIEKSTVTPPRGKDLEVLTTFAMGLHSQLLTGAHLGCVLVWFAAVWTTCWPSTMKSGPPLFAASLLCFNSLIQCADIQKLAARKEAQRKLEQEAAREREERITLCLGMVLRQLKVPILLLKSDTSICSPEPENAARALEVLKARGEQVWSIFTGLQTRIQSQLGADFADLGQSIDEEFCEAIQPQPVSLEGQVEAARPGGAADAARADLQDAEAARATSEVGSEAGAAGARPAEPASAPGPAPPRRPRPPSPASASSATSSFVPLRPAPRRPRPPSTASASSATSLPSSAGRGPRRRARGPLKGLRSVEVGFEATDPRFRISALTFHFATDVLGDRCPRMDDLFPQDARDFREWIEEHINNDFEVELPEDVRRIECSRSLGRLSLALTPLRPLLEVILQPLVLMETTPSCQAQVTYKKLVDGEAEEEGEEEGMDSSEEDGKVMAVVELSGFAKH